MSTATRPSPETKSSLLRTKSIEQSIEDTNDENNGLRRALGPLELVVFGVGVIIGTGIFVLTGEAAGTLAGPSIALSFVFAGIACALAALCYAEFASTARSPGRRTPSPTPASASSSP